jgi:hypothetical protein
MGAMTGRWLDLVLVGSLAAAAACLSLHSSLRLRPTLLEERTTIAWFEADIQDALRIMTDRQAGVHAETQVHPLFSLLVYPPVKALRSFAGVSPLEAVRIVLALAAALWMAGLAIVLRLLGGSRVAAGVFGLVALTSAGAIFWLGVPETYPFASLSLVLVLLVAALAQHRRLSGAWYALASAGSLSVTVTNWMAGWALLLARVPWRRAVQLSVNAFCLVVILWGIEKTIFPKARLFLENPQKGRAILHADAGGPGRILPSVLLHSVVMPRIVDLDMPHKGYHRMIVQPSAPGSGSRLGPAAVTAWVALFGLGLWGLVRAREHRTLRLTAGLTLLGQTALLLFYGEETFLYALLVLPLLIVVAAFSLATRAKRWAVGLAAVLAVLTGLNNREQHDRAIGLLARHATPARLAQQPERLP